MNKSKILNEFGFSLIEVMVVVVIAGVMLLAWNFISTEQIKKVALNEGRTLVEQVVAQERIYRARTGSFQAVSSKNKNDNIMVDTYGNKYFKNFIVSLSGTTGLFVTAQGSVKPVSGVNVIGTYNAVNDTLKLSGI